MTKPAKIAETTPLASANSAIDAVTRRNSHDPQVVDCPHAAPFRYCETCKVSPCPVGLGCYHCGAAVTLPGWVCKHKDQSDPNQKIGGAQ